MYLTEEVPQVPAVLHSIDHPERKYKNPQQQVSYSQGQNEEVGGGVELLGDTPGSDIVILYT